mmetsp:Transcript_26346/g.55054  ORF Transcript_26346/g.55054 Transcript_26346/m.55054 type:complete len:235 (+) Transcript_26346:805-1509(+)
MTENHVIVQGGSKPSVDFIRVWVFMNNGCVVVCACHDLVAGSIKRRTRYIWSLELRDPTFSDTAKVIPLSKGPAFHFHCPIKPGPSSSFVGHFVRDHLGLCKVAQELLASKRNLPLEFQSNSFFEDVLHDIKELVPRKCIHSNGPFSDHMAHSLRWNTVPRGILKATRSNATRGLLRSARLMVFVLACQSNVLSWANRTSRLRKYLVVVGIQISVVVFLSVQPPFPVVENAGLE